MTRLWRTGDPIEVQINLVGELVGLTWRGQHHAVQAVVNSWQVDREWWDQRIWRDYFKLETKTGLLVILYHDLVTDSWSLQRLYD